MECQRLKAETFTDPTVVAALKQTVPVSLDYFKDKDYVKQFKIPYPPDMMLIDAQGRVYGEAMMFHPPKPFLRIFEGMMEIFKSAASVERAFDSDPKNGAAAARAAKLFAARRELDRATAAADRMSKLDFRDADASHSYQRVGETLMNNERAAKAVGYFLKAAELSSTVDEKGNAYLGLANCYLAEGDKPNALKYSKMILELPKVNPNLIKYAKGVIAAAEKG